MFNTKNSFIKQRKNTLFLFLGNFFSILIIYIILIQSFNFLCYGYKGFIFRLMDHCKSYDSLSNVISISKDAAYLAVERMMEFLHNPKMRNLSYVTVINGYWDEFFSDITYYHLVDVKKIIIFCLKSSKIFLVPTIIFLTVSILTKNISRLYGIWKRAFITFIVIIIGLISFAIINFNNLFVIFHEILFDNDLWLLYPNEDYLINLLPEEFFAKFALCGIILFLVFGLAFSFFLKTLSRLEAKSDL